MIVAYFDRSDICAAHVALEHDWTRGGWLPERPSNQRRMEGTHVQARRIGYRPSPMQPAGFAGLQNDNQREIYTDAMQAYGLHPDQDDPVTRWLKGEN